ncbi:hypothetical protein EJB05_36568, partial [Eragrostis curvula]
PKSRGWSTRKPPPPRHRRTIASIHRSQNNHASRAAREENKAPPPSSPSRLCLLFENLTRTLAFAHPLPVPSLLFARTRLPLSLMVLMAADDSDHHRPAAKPAPASPSPSPAPPSRTRLHGFTFPTLSWGTHRLLRCSKDGGASGTASASPPPHPQTPSPHKTQGGGAGGASQPPQRPWNLRARRSATVAPTAARSEQGTGKAAAWQAPQPLASPLAAEPKKRGFSVALTKEEIAEDFLAIRGARPPRRPKKRPRVVQRQLDMLYPGLSLADVTLDSYKIEER